MQSRSVRDTFLRYLADNIGDIPVHARRRDTNDPGADQLQMNAVNVEFDDWLTARIAEQRVFVDVIADDEHKAVEWLEVLSSVLEPTIAPILDYTDPANPTDTGAYLVWEREQRFIRVQNDNYCHYALDMTLRSQRR
jgi:hypothetical protein